MKSAIARKGITWLNKLEEYSGRKWEWDPNDGESPEDRSFTCHLLVIEDRKELTLEIEYLPTHGAFGDNGEWECRLSDADLALGKGKTPIKAWVAAKLALAEQNIVLKTQNPDEQEPTVPVDEECSSLAAIFEKPVSLELSSRGYGPVPKTSTDSSGKDER
jgi:hypothetical protein